jgi:threonine dehydrogenase-like Zn-dependent dehydrogenase
VKGARTAVLTAPRTLEIREVPLPVLGADDGLLEVEVNGVCGSDAEFYDGTLAGYPMPMTIGHEPVGRVVALGENARRRWGVEAGDRVVVNSALRCGHCEACAAGRDCRSASYGTLPPDLAPGLWGGIATHLYLPPQATLIPLPDTVTLADAAFHNPLANGFEWAGEAGKVGAGSRVAVLGAGPRGLACALVSCYLGAGHVVLAGLRQDASRLELAERMGVPASLILESDDQRELIDAFGERDVVIDTTPHAVSAVGQGLSALCEGGRLVLAGIKGRGRSVQFDVDEVVRRRLTLIGPWSKSLKSLKLAVEAVGNGGLNLGLIPSRGYPLNRAAEAIESLSSQDPGRPLHVRVEPGLGAQ